MSDLNQLNKSQQAVEKEWEDEISGLLKNKTILSVRFMNDAEMQSLDWYERSIALLVGDEEGAFWIFPSQDEEGNGPGALFTTHPSMPTIPTM